MKRSNVSPWILLLNVPLSLIILEVGMTVSSQITLGADKSRITHGIVPTEDDVHQIMEYVNEPTYKRLKPVMASQPADDRRWKSIVSDALILADGANLLVLNEPLIDAAQWTRLAVSVRDRGGEFYRAAKEKDFPASRKAYEAMLNSCNACHEHFAGGKRRLIP